MKNTSIDGATARIRSARAKSLLHEGGYTLVCCSETETVTAQKRGVAPLMDLLNDQKTLHDFCAADKVVGKAAAFLYVLLGVECLYADVISEPACEVLSRFGIAFEAEKTVSAIRNRAGDGFCPMETAVRDVDSPDEALVKIKETLQKLRQESV